DCFAARILDLRSGRRVGLAGHLAQGGAHALVGAHQGWAVAALGVQTEERPPQPLVARVQLGELLVQLDGCWIAGDRIELGEFDRRLLKELSEVLAEGYAAGIPFIYPGIAAYVGRFE